MQKEICHAARTSKYQMENHRNRGKKLRDKIVEQEEKVQKDKQRSTEHTYKTKDRVTRTPLNQG